MATIKYSLSFTTGALFYHESVKLAALYQSVRHWDKVRDAVMADNTIQARTANTLKRVTSEITSRLKTLSEQEVIFLNNAEYVEQKYILWLSICRRYTFIADFAADILHGKFVSLMPYVTYEDYDIFFSKKAEWHVEFERIAASTKRKLRQTLFKMMREANLVDKKNTIMPILPSVAFRAVLARVKRPELMFFPILEPIRQAE